eukprot:7115988-Pyramimonas_sp.AAC.1
MRSIGNRDEGCCDSVQFGARPSLPRRMKEVTDESSLHMCSDGLPYCLLSRHKQSSCPRMKQRNVDSGLSSGGLTLRTPFPSTWGGRPLRRFGKERSPS